jgi:hypothetical protein
MFQVPQVEVGISKEYTDQHSMPRQTAVGAGLSRAFNHLSTWISAQARRAVWTGIVPFDPRGVNHITGKVSE